MNLVRKSGPHIALVESEAHTYTVYFLISIVYFSISILPGKTSRFCRIITAVPRMVFGQVLMFPGDSEPATEAIPLAAEATRHEDTHLRSRVATFSTAPW
jgi:hypothetical protein